MGKLTLITSVVLMTALVGITLYFVEQKKLLRQDISIVNIHDMNFYSKASYCSVEKLQNWNCGEECQYHAKMQDVKAYYDSGKESQGYCGYNGESNQIVVAFRGTYDLKNWLTDFKAFPVDYSVCEDCKVHMGFRDHFAPIQDNIVECVKEQLSKHPKAKVIVTGHSLGGAVATLAIVPISQLVNDPSQVYLYTFGAPRVGNDKFAAYLNKQVPNSYRVVNYHDIVPHVPFKELIFNFNHHGYEIWMTKEDSADDYKVCFSESGESKDCASSVLPFSFSTKDHTNYFGIYTGCNADLPSRQEHQDENEKVTNIFKQMFQSLEQ